MRAMNFVSVVLFLLFTSCPAFAEMQKLDLEKLAPDLSPFLAAGCVDNDQEKGFVCPPDVRRRFGCSELKRDDRVGGIDMPVALCTLAMSGNRKGKRKDESSVGSHGCMIRVPFCYVLYTTRGFKVAKSADELISLAAPFDKPEKVASLVMALDPRVNAVLPEPSEIRMLKVRDKKYLEASWSQSSGGAIAVRLFQMTPCGCGTHPIFAVDYEVSSSGHVEEKGRRMVMDGKREICID